VKVAVTGATGIVGRAAVRALVEAGHDVFGLARTAGRARLVESLGATPVHADLFDPDSLLALFTGCDVVYNLATRVPVGSLREKAWREHDRILRRGAAAVAEAAERAGVRRLVQESTCSLYADHGEEWVTEDALLDITVATEPASMAESAAQCFAADSLGAQRTAVILRLGRILGEDPQTRWMLGEARRRRAFVVGPAEAWTPVLHIDDLAGALAAALDAPGGTYNVAAEPVRRRELLAGFAIAVDRPAPGMRRSPLRGDHAEPLRRSVRVATEHLTAQTGWAPLRPIFDPSWFDALVAVGAR